LFFQYTAMLRNPIEQISRQMEQLQAAAASIGRIRDLWAIQPTQKDGSDTAIPAGPLSVRFDGVTFAYGDNDPVLKQVSFHLPAGRVLGLLGRTGSGKTTLTRLLFRLYDPAAGRVQVGGVDTGAARLRELRTRVGMVTQEVQLFHASVRDNLTFFDAGIPDGRILQVLDDLHLRPWLATLPQGLDTELSSDGSGLSAGEAQLLAFTRVFLQDPGLVILDEPSSRLDPATEHLLEQAVSKLLRDRTAIIIAHRLKTVLRADDILILEHGEIREHGPRAALEADPASHFSHLLQVGLEKELA
jgi:ABC-type multidrug transport system fused ATPase/permease subunit